MLDFNMDQISLRDKRLFEITEVDMTRVDCILLCAVLSSVLDQIWDVIESVPEDFSYLLL